MHVVVNRRSTKAGVGIISQKDMAVTQFLFMGFHVLMPREFGLVASHEQFEALSHFWRVIGFMLGTEDRFNACGETLEETKSRLLAIKEDLMLPATENPFPGVEDYVRTGFEGMWHSDPSLHFGEFSEGFVKDFCLNFILLQTDSLKFVMKRAIGLPGYHFFESENKNGDKSVFDSLSLYTKFRVVVEIFVYEYLSHIFLFRWFFNLMRFSLALLSKYPFLAIRSFGKKYAYVEIMKPKKK